MDVLEKLLFDLHSCVDDPDSVLDAQFLVQNIESYIYQLELAPGSELEYILFFLCQSESPLNLLQFIIRTVRTKFKDFVKAKVSILKFFSGFIKVIGPNIETYGNVIFNACLDVLKLDDSNEVKASSILPMRQLLHLSFVGFELDPIEFDIERTYQLLLSEYSEKKATGGTKYQSLVTLGYLVQIYPYHTSTLSRINQILNISQQILTKSFKSKSSAATSASDLSQIASAFSCLDRCLYNYEDNFVNNVEIWKYLVMALSGIVQESVTRFAMIGKSLRLIKHHASLFRDCIGMNMTKSYQFLMECYQSEKTVCKKHAEEALISVLTEFSMYIISRKSDFEPNSVIFDTLKTITLQYLSYLEDAAVTSSKNLSLAVQGLTALAPSIAHLNLISIDTMSNTAIGNIVQKLISACEYLLLQDSTPSISNQYEEENLSQTIILKYRVDIIKKKTQFFLAILVNLYSELSSKKRSTSQSQSQSQRQSQLPTLTMETYRYLLNLSSEIVVSYSRMWGTKAQSLAQKTLCLFLYIMNSSSCPPYISLVDEVIHQIIPNILIRAMSRKEEGEKVELFALDITTGEVDGKLHYMYALLWNELFLPRNPETVRLLKLMSSVDGEQTSTPLWKIIYPQYLLKISSILITSLLSEISKTITMFDLSYTLPSAIDNPSSLNLETGESPMQSSFPIPTNPADHELLLNTVAFLEDISESILNYLNELEKSEIDDNNHKERNQVRENVKNWIFILAEICMKKSVEWPLVSALYRVMRLLTNITSEISKNEQTIELMDPNESYGASESKGEKDAVVDAATNLTTAGTNDQVILEYYEEVGKRILSEFHHPELMNASLFMIFSAPSSLLSRISFDELLVPLINHSLTTGIQSKLCLNVLFILHDQELLTEDSLILILPKLNKYLTSPGDEVTGSDSKVVTMKNKTYKKPNNNILNGGILISTKDLNDSDMTSSNTMQILAVKFLGRLGGRNKMILSTPHDTIQTTISWSCFENKLQIQLPYLLSSDYSSQQLPQPQLLSMTTTMTITPVSQFSNLPNNSNNTLTPTPTYQQLQVSLGHSIPRIIELCLDKRPEGKQLRVIAAECLHGFVLLLIGQAATDNTGSNTSAYVNMFEKIIPALIALACSTETVTKNLFDRLLSQIIHWLSSVGQTTSSSRNAHLIDMANILLSSLLDGLSPTTSSSNNIFQYDISTREICTSSLIEYFRWLQKHHISSNTDLADAVINNASVDGIITNLLALSTHPNNDKRLGAAGVLNKLYIYLREDMSLVLKYLLRIIFALLNAVKLIGVSQEACSLAVNRYVKIFVKISVGDDIDAALLRQGKWKSTDTRRKAQDKLKMFSHTSDLTQASDQPSFPYTLRDLVNWIWSQVTTSDYIFRRQCMACLGDFCPLLPLPEHRVKAPKGKTRRPPHLQSVCDFIFSLQELQGVTTNQHLDVAELITNNMSIHLSNTYRQLYQQFSRSEINDQINEDLEIRWLEALNGSLDGYNWLIKCLETVPASTLFVTSEESVSQNEEVDKKGTKRKRQQSASDPLENINLLPRESNIPRGQVMIRNLLFFFRLCCIRLLNVQYRGVKLLSFLQSTLTGRSKQQQYHERLILEVFRRSIQLLSVLLESDPNHFINYFQSNGICVSGNNNEFSPEIQFLLLCGLGVIDMTDIKNNYHNTSRQRNIIHTLEAIADHVVHEISTTIPGKSFEYHFSKLPYLLSFSEILKDHSLQSIGNRMGNDSSSFQSEEYTTNIPIAIEQLLSFLSQSNRCNLLTSSLWSDILKYNLESLTPSSTLSSVLAIQRSMSTLKKCNILNIPFGNQFQTTLKAIGNSLIQATISTQNQGTGTGTGPGTGTEPVSSQHFSLTPTAIEVGSILLGLSIEFGVPIATSSPSFLTSSSSSLIDTILSLPHAPPSDSPQVSGEMFLQYYGNTLVDLLIGMEGEEDQFLNNCKLFLNMMVLYSERCLNSHDTSTDFVMKRCTLLLTKICIGIIERSSTMKEETLADFVHLYSEQIYKESLQYPSPSVFNRYAGTGNQSVRLMCTRESIGLILHLESLLPRPIREDKGLLRNSPLVLVTKKIRHFLFQNILYVFNCCSDSSIKEISSPLFDGDLCDNIVKAFQLLPYVIPGTTATCPRPTSPSMEELQELKNEEETMKTELVTALEEVVAAKFPMNSAALDKKSNSGKVFTKVLKAWLECFSTTGTMYLLEPLSPTLREGRGHCYYQWIKESIQKFVSNIESSPSNPSLSKEDKTQQLLSIRSTTLVLSQTHSKSLGLLGGVSQISLLVSNICISVMMDPYQDMNIKCLYFDDICVPVLKKCSSLSLTELCCSSNDRTLNLSAGDQAGGSLIKQLVDVISTHQNIISSLAGAQKGGYEFEPQLLQVLCAFMIIETVYDRCTVDDIKGSVTRAYAGDGATGKELTQAICRCAHKLVRQVPPRLRQIAGDASFRSENAIESLAQRVQSAAFNCLLVVVAKTQQEEQFFDTFIFKEKSVSPDQQFWGNIIDCSLQYVFDADGGSPSFDTAYLGGYFNKEMREMEREILGNRPKYICTDSIGLGSVLSQQILRSSSQLLSGSNLKHVYSQSQSTFHSYSQSQTEHNTSNSSSSNSNSHSSLPLATRVVKRNHENPRDSFATLTQNVNDSSSALPIALVNPSNEYDIDGEEYQDGLAVKGFDDCTIALEMNDINQQKCMGLLVRVIYRMFELFQGKWQELSTRNNVPYWITVCRDKLNDYSALPSSSTRSYGMNSFDERKNIRLFMLRLLMNQPVAAICKPFIPTTLFKSILDCCLYDLCGVRNHSDSVSHEHSYNYVLRDVVFTLVDSWSDALEKAADDPFNNPTAITPLPYRTVTESVTAFLSYMLRHVYPLNNDSLSADVVKDNLKSVCALIALWVRGNQMNTNSDNNTNFIRGGLDLSHIVQLISVSDAAPTGGAHAKATSKGTINVRRRLCGLQILLALLKAKYPLFEERSIEENTNARDILTHVCNGCKFPRKEVYEQSAAVCGAILQSLVEANQTRGTSRTSTRLIPETSKFCKDVELKLNSIYLSTKNGSDVVATCLRSVARNCPSFLTRELLLKMFASFGTLKSKSRGDFLEVLCLSTSPDDSDNQSKFSGISVLENMKAYLPSLLNDVSTVAYGRGNSLRNLPHIQILTLRLLRVHASEFILQNVLLSLLNSSSDGNGGVNTNSVGLLKVVNEATLLEVRQEAFAMLMSLHGVLTKLLASPEHQNSSQIFKIQLGIVRVLLLRGLTDSDDEGMQGTEELPTSEPQSQVTRVGIRKTIFDFFEEHFGMSTCPVNRLSTLLTDLFDPIGAAISSSTILRVEDSDQNMDSLPAAFTGITVSDQWLRYSAYLLLGACKNDDVNGLQKKLFSRGLAADDTFAPVQVSRAILSQSTQSGSQSLTNSSQYESFNSSTPSANPMTPMFAIETTQSHLYGADGMRSRVIKGTQQFAWTQTQGNVDLIVNEPTPFSWNSVVGQPPAGQRVSTQERSFYTQYLGNNQINTTGSASSSITQGQMGPPTGLPQYYSQGLSQKTITQRVPMRFFKSVVSTSGDSSDGSAEESRTKVEYKLPVYEMVTSQRRLQKIKQDKLKRSAKITVLRRYRDGEFPDICIALSDIIVPLQALCLKDPTLASVVFDQLFEALYSLVNDSFQNDTVGDTMRRSLSNMISHHPNQQENMDDSLSFSSGDTSKIVPLTNTTLVASILKACQYCVANEIKKDTLTSSQLTQSNPLFQMSLIDPERIGDVAAASLNYHSGIFFLEQQLLVRFHLENTTGVPIDIKLRSSIWMQLARLYGALEEKDMLVGLLYQISQVPLTRQALDAEIKGDYPSSIDLYNKLIIASERNQEQDSESQTWAALAVDDEDKTDRGNNNLGDEMEKLIRNAPVEEKSMWHKRSLDCLRQLLDWDQLYEKVDGISHSGDDGNRSLIDRLLRKISNVSPNELRRQSSESNASVCDEFDLLTSSLSWLIPHYVRSVTHLGGYTISYDPSAGVTCNQGQLWNETSDFLRNILQTNFSTRSDDSSVLSTAQSSSILSQLKLTIEKNYSSDISMCFLSTGETSRAQAFAEMSYTRFLESWSSLHPCALSSKNSLLSSLEKVVEIEDGVNLISPSNKSLSSPSFDNPHIPKKLVPLLSTIKKWDLSLPSHSDPLWVWNEISRIRSVSLLQYYNRYLVDCEDCGDEVSALAMISIIEHLGTLHINTAITAIGHNMMQIVKNQLGVSNTLRRSLQSYIPLIGEENSNDSASSALRRVTGRGSSTHHFSQVLSMPEVSTVYQFNKRSIHHVIQEHDGDFELMRSKVLPMYEKTLTLLEKKMESCQFNTCSFREKCEYYQTVSLQGEWFASWGRFIKENSTDQMTSTGNTQLIKRQWGQKMIQAYDVFVTLSQEITKASSSSSSAAAVSMPRDVTAKQLNEITSSECIFGKLGKHCDEMISILEEEKLSAGSLALSRSNSNKLEMISENIFGRVESMTTLAEIGIDAYINGLVQGDNLCRSRILRLFSLIGKFVCDDPKSTQLDPILKKIKKIPAWIFLRYSAQIVGLIDRPEGPVVVAVLEHIASSYPRALFYAFKVTSPSLSTRGQQLIGKLQLLLVDELSDCLITSLSGLTHPELRWSDGLKQIGELYRQKKKAEAETTLEELKKEIIDLEWPLIGSKIGLYNSRFARFMAKKLNSAQSSGNSNAAAAPTSSRGTRGSTASTGSHSQGKSGSVGLSAKTLDSLLNSARELTGSGGGGWTMKYTSGKVPLAEFSEWLTDLGSLLLSLSAHQYQTNMGGMETFQYNTIEIPGQYSYDTNREPMVERHSLIISVHSELLVMSSIRKPKRICFLGSCGNEFMFLVKGGEDLRNDERIEQLFVLMNRILSETSTSSSSSISGSKSPTTRSRLHARTFSVIPMTPKVGILEWVQNTMPLKSIISEEMAKDPLFLSLNRNCISKTNPTNKSVDLSSITASEERLKWMKGHDAACYHDVYKKARAEVTYKLWKKMMKTTPDDFLRRKFLSMSSTPEVFLTLRSECALSLSVSCIFGYILGIGDRHLENLLLDLQGGSIVQIDFGICFGMGASVLPVPELIPFRLTSQLRALFQPLDGTNLLRHYMIQTLQSIQSDYGRETLENALEIYVNDPVVDWLKGTYDKEEMNELRDDLQWEPRRRIHNAMRKINGYHPVHLLVEELKQNARVKQFDSVDSITSILWQSANNTVATDASSSSAAAAAGNSSTSNEMKQNLIKRKPDYRIDTASQVDVLINLATDPNILTRQWVGLLPWL